MKKIRKLIFLTLLALISSVLITFIVKKINENRCYNLPLNDFYKDKTCIKYIESWSK